MRRTRRRKRRRRRMTCVRKGNFSRHSSSCIAKKLWKLWEADGEYEHPANMERFGIPWMGVY
eukprot:4893025-Pyramimonas_sp.AAC.1